MTYFPNVRDEKEACAYYEGNLNKENSEFMHGCDYAIEEAENALDNILDNYVDWIKEEYIEELKETFSQWMEGSRNMIVVALIEGQDDYDELVEKY